MATSRFFIALSFLALYFRAIAADTSMSFSFSSFDKNSNFESQLALYGDAKVVNGGVGVELTDSFVPSAGRVMYKKPIKVVEGNPRKMISLSMHLVFSISGKDGDGLAIVMVPKGFPSNVSNGSSFGLGAWKNLRFVGVEFDTFTDEKYGDLNSNHVGIDVGSLISVKVSNLSSVNLTLNSGEKLQTWIDYEASSKRLEVRLSKFGNIRPVEPLLSCPIDLSHMWKEDEILVGLSSSNGNSSQKCIIYSWSLKLRSVPHWIHSQPLDPEPFLEKREEENAQKKNECALKVLAALLFGTGCGALGAFAVLFIWTIFWSKRPVVPEAYAVEPKKFEYKSFKVVVDKVIEDGRK